MPAALLPTLAQPATMRIRAAANHGRHIRRTIATTRSALVPTPVRLPTGSIGCAVARFARLRARGGFRTAWSAGLGRGDGCAGRTRCRRADRARPGLAMIGTATASTRLPRPAGSASPPLAVSAGSWRGSCRRRADVVPRRSRRVCRPPLAGPRRAYLHPPRSSPLHRMDPAAPEHHRTYRPACTRKASTASTRTDPHPPSARRPHPPPARPIRRLTPLQQPQPPSRGTGQRGQRPRDSAGGARPAGRSGPWPPSAAGIRFDEGDMRYSDAIFFTPDGKVVRDDHPR